MAGFAASVCTVQSTATEIVTVGSTGVLVQNTGGGPVTLGGPDVEWEQGIMLPANMDRPLWVPGGGEPGGMAVVGQHLGGPLTLYGRTLSGTSKIAYLVPG